jgi:hypothetical protein
LSKLTDSVRNRKPRQQLIREMEEEKRMSKEKSILFYIQHQSKGSAEPNYGLEDGIKGTRD